MIYFSRVFAENVGSGLLEFHIIRGDIFNEEEDDGRGAKA